MLPAAATVATPSSLVTDRSAFAASTVTASVSELLVSSPSGMSNDGSTEAVFESGPAAVGLAVKDRLKVPPIPMITGFVETVQVKTLRAEMLQPIVPVPVMPEEPKVGTVSGRVP